MNWANIISLFRLMSAPFIGYFLLSQQFNKAFILFILASISDILDGYIARQYDEKTLLGRYLDPIADKVLLSITTIALWHIYILPSWFLMTLILRDNLIILGAYKLYKDGHKSDVKPHFLGKISTFLQILLILACFVHLTFAKDSGWCMLLLLYSTELSLIVSGLFYGYFFIKKVYSDAYTKRT